MSSYTLSLKQDQINQMHTALQAYLTQPVPYSIFRAKIHGVTITAYQSGKVLFQGQAAQDLAEDWIKRLALIPGNKLENSKKKEPSKEDLSQLSLIGSDEVGNGSYFGALTVSAVYLDPKQFDQIKQLGVKDSKLLTDEQIIELANKLKDQVTHHTLICLPHEYNRLIGTYNAVSLKVRLHNQAHQAVLKQLKPDELEGLQGILVDQFTSGPNYHKYLLKEEKPIRQGLIFRQKAENLHLSVACASILARTAFLQSLQDLGQAYQTILPSGAGSQVDDFGRRLVKAYGPQVLQETAKLHFKNTEKILNQDV